MFGGSLPPVVKNLMIINGLMYLAAISLPQTTGIDIYEKMALYPIDSAQFHPIQFITHLFLHSKYDFGHILANMFMLFILGIHLERAWGSQKFLIYYLLTGFGAATLHVLVIQYQISEIAQNVDQQALTQVINEGRNILLQNKQFIDPSLAKLNLLYNIPTVGASGAVFGVLLAFGMLWPNMTFYFYFLFPIKAKYFITIYALAELCMGVFNRPGDNVAHFAHLGGMLFGFIILKYWKAQKAQ